mmetsp:Transcript_164/g.215  ORF Transcript_164/g.215 Transcript_164/m.215 type:complete len:265 (+) Transcript_164:133-927(+)|eukprot:CAMPEP_0184025112 /NCGR_PEP_ID=MMETSP0954-20121128/12565_1 /TAXON_ID=627963 /ORGANISM="Aplanochytrium sp, Strain PBS07" /LENGTH=264 /DNA_ID=CAMNT_0026308731 /DNA_START=81 /DNA_END=875 /DNA_ORIENTATION=-
MSGFIDLITSTKPAASRNVADDDDEAAAALEAENRVCEVSFEDCDVQSLSIETGVLWISMGLTPKRFIEASFPECKSFGTVKIGSKPIGRIFLAQTNLVIKFIDEEAVQLEAAYDVAVAVVEHFSSFIDKVVVLDTLWLSTLVSENTSTNSPPMVRMICSGAAKKDLEAAQSEKLRVPFLETGNVVKGFSAAVLQECEMLGLWAVGVFSFLEIRHDARTALAFIPLLKVVSEIECGCTFDCESVREELLKIESEKDYARDAMFL